MKIEGILTVIDSMEEINDIIAKKLKVNIPADTQALNDCQDAVIEIGNEIEKVGQGAEETVRLLEAYCENLYQMYSNPADINLCRKLAKKIQRQLMQIRNKVKYELQNTRKQVVFLPYKASMWDSLESVWRAADADPECDAYVIPIPYYDRNADGSFGAEHYEGNEYPDYVPVTHYHDYDFEVNHPDAVFIHNPYDQYNNVTSVHPFFYSKHLKEFTDLLVYVPYYSTSGGMSAAQSQCIAYYYVDYIVIQSEKYRKFFAADLPDEKFLPFGSPKFDKVVNACKNPPEPPEEWKEKMAGRKVYFYNTSIAGMLGNTPLFLKKLEYVFRCFADREDACLLWRPHPLLESTFDSMRPEYRPVYDALKKYFLMSGLGIYDDTPDMTNAIAHSYAYIGDAGSSVISLFGLAGKPIFILNKNIDSEPGEDDWRGEILKGPYIYGNNQWMITQGNKLYYSQNNDYRYHYCCDLSEYAYGNYYLSIVSIHEKNYACPAHAENILVVDRDGIKKIIELEHYVDQKKAFDGAITCEDYIFLIPKYYPAIVKYDTVHDQVIYLKDNLDIVRGVVQGELINGGYCVHNGYLFIASPSDNRVLRIHVESGKEKVLEISASHMQGYCSLSSDGNDLWLLPYSGNIVTRWNPENGETCEYADYPSKLQCRHPIMQYECMEKPFNKVAFMGDYVYLPPWWANMYVRLDKKSGVMTEWKPPFEQLPVWKNRYFFSWGKGFFGSVIENTDNKIYLFYSAYDRKIYHINLETNEAIEINREFDLAELHNHEPGFHEKSEEMQYACQENAFNSLPNFLDGKITGNQFDKERAIHDYERIAANNDGTSGEKIYQFIIDKLLNKQEVLL